MNRPRTIGCLLASAALALSCSLGLAVPTAHAVETAGARSAQAGEELQLTLSTGFETAFPVQVIQKTGPDTERINWLFVGEGYTADEQDKFIKDVRTGMARVLKTDPFRAYAPYMNVYAMCVESRDSGVTKYGGTVKDTYFKVLHGNGSGSAASDRIALFTEGGKERMADTVADFREHYLEAGASLLVAGVMVNTSGWMGAGGDYPIMSSSAAGYMILHEGAHSFAGLADEYTADFQVGDAWSNKDFNVTAQTAKWSAFAGFRGIGAYTHEGTTTGAVRPSNSCIMLTPGNGSEPASYCEVCRDHIASVLDARLPEELRRPVYSAKPEVVDAATGKQVDPNNIIDQAGKTLTIRGLFRNRTVAERAVTLRWRVVNRYSQVQASGEIPATLPAGEVSQVSDAVQVPASLEERSSLIVEVFDRDGSLLETASTISVFGDSKIAYKLGDTVEGLSASKLEALEDVPGVAEQGIYLMRGESMPIAAPLIPGYVYVGEKVFGADLSEDGGMLTSWGAVITVYRVYRPVASSAEETGGRIAFLGGALRMDGADPSVRASLRLGYTFEAPEGATVLWDRTGWAYGLTEETAAGMRPAEHRVKLEDGSYLANAVFANIPATSYGTSLFARARLAYRLPGDPTVYTLTATAPNARSVDEVASRIVAAGAEAPAVERSLAEAIRLAAA